MAIAANKILAALTTLVVVVGFMVSGCSEDLMTPNNTDQTPTYRLTTNVSPAGGGGVIRTPDMSSYATGSTVTLTVEPNAGFQFTGWTGVPSGVNALSPEITLTMNRDVTAIAYFEAIPAYTVTYDGNGSTGGTVPADANSPYSNRSNVTVLGHGSLVRADHVFGGWNTAADGSGTNYAADAVFSIIGNITLYARWIDQSKPVYQVTVSGIGVGASGSGRYTEGMTVQISAGTAEGQRFVNWTTASSGVVFSNADSSGTTFVMPANEVVVTANFETIPTYQLSVVSNGVGASGSGSYIEGASVMISAGTVTGHRFIGWTTNSGNITLASVNSPTTSFTMPAGSVMVTANFEEVPKESYLVTVASPGINISGAGSYLQGETVTVNAGTPPSGQMFVGWTTASSGVTFVNPNSAITTFTMPGNAVVVTANFRAYGADPYFLGYGYDILYSPFILESDIKRLHPVLNQRKMIAENFAMSERVAEQDYEMFAGNSLSEFLIYKNERIKLGAGVKIPLFIFQFSAEVSTEFGVQTTQQEINRHSYVRGRAHRYTRREYIGHGNARPEILKDYLADGFIADLRAGDVNVILNRYGTHVLVQYYKGGVIEFNYAYHGTELNTREKLTTAASASLSVGIGGFSAGFSAGTAVEAEAYRRELESNSTFRSRTYGGRAVNLSSVEAVGQNYNEWNNSINDSNAAVCDIGLFNDSFVAIWELAEAVGEVELARELENEFLARATKQEENFLTLTGGR